MMHALALGLLALRLQASPAEESSARLAQALSGPIQQGTVSLAVEGEAVVVRLEAPRALEDPDQRWKTLGALALESRRGDVRLRVEVETRPTKADAEAQVKACSADLLGVVRYLFDKQKVDRRRVTVIGRCTVGAVPAR